MFCSLSGITVVPYSPQLWFTKMFMLTPTDELIFYMSRIVRKPDFCLCENKGADQLRCHCEAGQRLCSSYTDSSSSKIRNFRLLSCFCDCTGGFVSTWSEPPKTGFLASRLNYYPVHSNSEQAWSITHSMTES